MVCDGVQSGDDAGRNGLGRRANLVSIAARPGLFVDALPMSSTVLIGSGGVAHDAVSGVVASSAGRDVVVVARVIGARRPVFAFAVMWLASEKSGPVAMGSVAIAESVPCIVIGAVGHYARADAARRLHSHLNSSASIMKRSATVRIRDSTSATVEPAIWTLPAAAESRERSQQHG
jgi:hypothetical protein